VHYLFEEGDAYGLAIRAYIIVLLLNRLFVNLRVASETQHKGFDHQSYLILNYCIVLNMRTDATNKNALDDS
jgi:hypothetical protein